MTPLWLCLKIRGGREKRAHELFLQHQIASLPPLTQTVRVNRHHRTAAQRTAERMLLPSYAFVARDNSEPTWFEARLMRLQWPGAADEWSVLRDAKGDVVNLERRNYQPVTDPVVQRIVGWVRHQSVMDLIDACEAQQPYPAAPTLKAGDKARILVAGDMREVMLSVVRGKRVKVMLDGREISTTVDKLEAA